jgi:hypothetical protein
MANVGDLVVNLLGKNDQLTAKLGQSSRDLSKFARHAGDEMSKIGTKQGGLGGMIGDKLSAVLRGGMSADTIGSLVGGAAVPTAIVAAAAAYGAHLLSSAENAERLSLESKKLGVGVVMLQQMEREAGRMGISVDVVTKGVMRLQNSVVEGLSTPSKGSVFKQLGLDAGQLVGMMPEEALGKTAKAIMSIGNAAIRTNVELQLFGKAGKELEPILQVLSEGKISNKQGALDWSPGDIAALNVVDDAWDSIKESVKWIGLQTLKPVINPMQWAMPELSTDYQQSAERARNSRTASDAKMHQDMLARMQAEETAKKQKEQEELARVREVEATKQRLYKQTEDLRTKWSDARTMSGIFGANDRETAMYREIAQQSMDKQRAGIPTQEINAQLYPLTQQVPEQAKIEALADAWKKVRDAQAMAGAKNDYERERMGFLISGVPRDAIDDVTAAFIGFKQEADTNQSLFSLDKQLRDLEASFAGTSNSVRTYFDLIAKGVPDQQALNDSMAIGAKQDQLRALQIRGETESPWAKMRRDLNELESLKGIMEPEAYRRQKLAIKGRALEGIALTPKERQSQLDRQLTSAGIGLADDLKAGRITEDEFRLGQKMEQRKFVDQSAELIPGGSGSFGAQERGSSEAWHSIMQAMGGTEKDSERKRLEEAAKKQMDAATALEDAGKKLAAVAQEFDPFAT